MVCQGEPAPCGSLQVLQPSVWPALTSHPIGQIGPQQWDDPPPPELPPLLLHLDQSPPPLFLPASLFPKCSTSPPLDMGQKHKLMRLLRSAFWLKQQYNLCSSKHFISTWFGYNLQAELHCAICLYSLIEEAVIRVKLQRTQQTSWITRENRQLNTRCGVFVLATTKKINWIIQRSW